MSKSIRNMAIVASKDIVNGVFGVHTGIAALINDNSPHGMNVDKVYKGSFVSKLDFVTFTVSAIVGAKRNGVKVSDTETVHLAPNAKFYVLNFVARAIKRGNALLKEYQGDKDLAMAAMVESGGAMAEYAEIVIGLCTKVTIADDELAPVQLWDEANKRTKMRAGDAGRLIGLATAQLPKKVAAQADDAGIDSLLSEVA